MGRHQTSDEASRHAAARIAGRLAVIWLAVLLFPLVLRAADVVVLDVRDAITPPVASYLIENIDEAVVAGREAVIIRMDTPGGLDTAMRDIIQKEMNADIPVIVYVAPKGARAASAGALITLAADVAAMAPGTNIGAAHPVSIATGGEGAEGQSETMTEKITNDAVAYAKSIARAKGRNEQWAEDAVKRASQPRPRRLRTSRSSRSWPGTWETFWISSMAGSSRRTAAASPSTPAMRTRSASPWA